ncbi:MAG: M23 family metallopeptidase [Deltaproteobacteria bacterium]|nr:M23 family metallopeptidase [Deltaproteobacteria bacterium]MDQ3297912.1 M23 family metallopeptidase [Myxococcota bacterium]
MIRKSLALTVLLASGSAGAGPLLLVTPRVAVETARVDQPIDLQLVPRGLVDHLVRWRQGVRDLVQRGSDGLAKLALEHGVPDLTALTIEPVARTESSGFGWRDDPIRHRPKFHSGTDFRGKRGTPVIAAGDGVVVFAGRRGGYGNVIFVDHGGGIITRYAHLRRIVAPVDATVSAGQLIGEMGSTGRTTGSHLHFEIRLAGRPVDPVMAMTVAQLQRESPTLGQIAAFALSPELQAQASSRLDPPRSKPSRPDRPGRVKRVRPLS